MSAVHRPEIGGLHLAALLAPGLDRGLIHRFHTAGSDRVELRVVDGFQQRDRLLTQLRQPGSADFNAAVLEALVLTIQRKMVGELVHEETCHEAHVGAAAFDHPHWGGRAADRLSVAALDHRAQVLEDDVATGTLRHAIAHLLAGHLVHVRRESCRLGMRQLDGLDRHARFVEERHALRLTHCRILLRLTAYMRGHQVLLGRDCLRRRGQHLSQSQLLRALQNPQPLTFGAEHLAL